MGRAFVLTLFPRVIWILVPYFIQCFGDIHKGCRSKFS